MSLQGGAIVVLILFRSTFNVLADMGAASEIIKENLNVTHAGWNMQGLLYKTEPKEGQTLPDFHKELENVMDVTQAFEWY